MHICTDMHICTVLLSSQAAYSCHPLYLFSVPFTKVNPLYDQVAVNCCKLVEYATACNAATETSMCCFKHEGLTGLWCYACAVRCWSFATMAWGATLERRGFDHWHGIWRLTPGFDPCHSCKRMRVALNRTWTFCIKLKLGKHFWRQPGRQHGTCTAAPPAR